MNIYLKKHLKLKEARAPREYSIADLIEEQPGVIELDIETHEKAYPALYLDGKSITSLYGITLLNRKIDPSKVLILHFNGNYILDNEHDPDSPKEPFKQFNNLDELSLIDNQLRSLSADFFKGIDRLKELNLSGNKFSSLPESIHGELHNLRELFLQENLISVEQQEKIRTIFMRDRTTIIYF